MGIGAAAVTDLALVVHERATNSVKYSALSVDTGTLNISGSLAGDDIRIDWTEHGGPDVVVPKLGDSCGSNLIRQTIEWQLGRSMQYDWSKAGLIVTILINVARLTG